MALGGSRLRPDNPRLGGASEQPEQAASSATDRRAGSRTGEPRLAPVAAPPSAFLDGRTLLIGVGGNRSAA
jgi:hypothetical protein